MYPRFLFKIDALPQDITFPLDIAATLFKKLSTDVRQFLMSEGFQVPPRPPIETNNQVNQRLLLVINVAVESEKRIVTIKAVVQPESGIRCPRTFLGMLGENLSIQMAGLGSSFQSE